MIKIADGRIIIDTEINNRGAENGIGKLNGIATKGLRVFTGVVAGAGVAIGGLGSIGIKYNAEMEQYMSSFTTMLGSADKATKHLNDLKTFAAKTPFEISDLAKASTTLLAFGVDVKEITPDLKMLGDISLGNKEKFNGLALVFGQVKSQGKLMGQDLMQMINQGFNPLQIISEKTGKSMSQLKDEMSKGQITYEMVADAMKTATSEGGKFYNAMQGQSKTLVGQWSTLKDNVNSLLGEMFKSASDTITNKVFPKVNEAVEKLKSAFANGELKESINKIVEGFGNLSVKLTDFIINYLPKIINGFSWILEHSSYIAAGITSIGTALAILKVASSVGKVVGIFKSLFLEIAKGTPILKAFNIVLGVNPFILIGAAIVGIVAGLVVLWNTNEGFRNAVIGAWNAIKAAGQAVWGWLVNFFTVTIPNAFSATLDWITSNWQGLLLLIVNPFVGGFKLLYDNCDGFRIFINQFIQAIKDFFINGWNDIVNFFTVTIPTWISNIITWFNELPGKIGYILGFLLGKIIKWGADTWKYLVTNVPIWINGVIQWFSQLPGRIWSWLTNVISKISAWGSQTYRNMVNGASRAINAAITWFSQLPGRVWTWLLNTISKVAQFASNLAAKAREAGLNMVEYIINAVTSLPGKMLNIGKDIVRGVWEGITGMDDWLASKVSDFFGGIVDGVKDALGIHSPSRVFRDQVGKYMAQGVGVGFGNESKNIKDSINKNLSNLVSSLNIDELSTKMTNAVYQEKAKTSSLLTSGVDKIPQTSNNVTNNDNGVTQNVTIVNPERTPSENARALRKVGRDLAFGY